MQIIKTGLEGVFVIKNTVFPDHRGILVKTFHKDIFEANGLEADFKESFYSVSNKNVLRGMHFQLPPNDHAKLVYVIDGNITDVAVDIHKDSPTFGKFTSFNLSGENAEAVYIAKGFAHGFLTLSDSATVVYMTTTVHHPESDTGIRWDSFGFEWGIKNPVLSDRDNNFKGLEALGRYKWNQR